MPERFPGQAQELELDVSHAHSARIYDYWLGGKDNFAADRDAAEQAIAANPGIVTDVRANRAFLARAVRYLASGCGIGQFLDIGTGLPTASNTHEVAQAAAPQARVVYVDNDPIVLAHARALLSSTAEGATAYIDADLRDTPAILEGARRTLDFSQPVALMLLIIEMTRRVNERMSGPKATLRDRAEITRFFRGLDLLEPGVVQPQQWRPEPAGPAPPQVTAWCGVARRR